MTVAKYLSAGLLAAISSAALACDNPSLIEIPEEAPEGRRLERLREATQDYFQAMTAYTQCIQAELGELGDNATDLQRGLLVARNNAAVAEVEAVLQVYAQRIEPLTALENASN